MLFVAKNTAFSGFRDQTHLLHFQIQELLKIWTKAYEKEINDAKEINVNFSYKSV